LQIFNIVQGCLPTLNDELPKEYQEVSTAAIEDLDEAETSDGEGEIKSGDESNEVDPSLPGKTRGQKHKAKEEAGRNVDGGNDSDLEITGNHTSRRVPNPSQIKVKGEMVERFKR
jgi:hypothetical protein